MLNGGKFPQISLLYPLIILKISLKFDGSDNEASKN